MKQKRLSFVWLGVAAGTLLVTLAFFAGRGWGPGAQWAAMIYAILVTLFLAAQIVGFVLTQVHYVDSVESAKFKVLEVEGYFREEPAREE